MNSVVLDLETCAIDDAATYLEPVSAPANYKDTEKIAAYVAEGTRKRLDEAGLDPDLNRIVCLGYLREAHDSTPRQFLCQTEHDERVALTAFWSDSASEGRLITFNGHRFDLPVLMRRSLYLGIPWRKLSIDRYRSDHIDLYQELTFKGAISGHSLNFYAQRFGLPGDLDATGAEIAELVRRFEWEAIKAKNAQDLWWAAALAQKLGYWDGVTTPGQARQTAMVL